MTPEEYAKKAREHYRAERMIDQYDTYFLPWDELQGSEKEAWLKVGHWVAEQVKEAEEERRGSTLARYGGSCITPARRSAINPPENLGKV